MNCSPWYVIFHPPNCRSNYSLLLKNNIRGTGLPVCLKSQRAMKQLTISRWKKVTKSWCWKQRELTNGLYIKRLKKTKLGIHSGHRKSTPKGVLLFIDQYVKINTSLFNSKQGLFLGPVQAKHFTLEYIFQMFFHGHFLNICRNRQHIFRFIEISRPTHFNSPLPCLGVKNIGPFFRSRCNKHTIGPGRQFFPVNGDVFAGGEKGRFISSAPPGFVVRNQTTPDWTAING